MSIRMYAGPGLGSSWAPAPPSPPSSDGFSSPSPPRARVVGSANYTHDNDDVEMAHELATRESEISAPAELELERAEQRRAIAPVRLREARERKEACASTNGAVVKLELADLIDLTDV